MIAFFLARTRVKKYTYSMFVPLNITSCYTFLQSELTMAKIASACHKYNFCGAAINDEGVLYGVPEFVKEMEKGNLKPLIGVKVTIDEEVISIYAINESGYKKIVKISSSIQGEGFDFNTLIDNHDGLVGIINTSLGRFNNDINNVNEHFTKHLLKISKMFDTFYLGLDINNNEQYKNANKIREFADKFLYDTIAFPTIKYTNKDDAIALTILNAIKDNVTITSKKEDGPYYFKSEDEIGKIYSKVEIENTYKLLMSSTFNYHQKRAEMIKFPVDDSISYLKKLVKEGLIKKGIDDEAHNKRANDELDVIISMGYADYFLVVSDYINYCKTHDILVAPGRGSSAGSLVAYLLNITEVDPLEYGLLFERFLNKARKTMPDIDTDFIDIKREDVIDYVRSKYGTDKVAKIVTFTTIGPKQALRDIGRIYKYSDKIISLLSKSILDHKSFKDAYLDDKNKAFKNLVDQDKYILEMVTLAKKIEGLPRQTSLHASGVILSSETLSDNLPVTSDMNGNLIDQYEGEYLEEQGFLKMDFLGIRNLTTIDYCINLIKQNHKDANIDKWNIPYKDPNIFKLLCSLQTMGIFQLESSGMKNTINVIKPKCFEDVIVTISIFRPGAMDQIKTYAKRASGIEKPTYYSKELENILAPTQGIMIYQEQVSQIAQVMAGYSASEADIFRRAVSKKKADLMEQNKESFIKGSIKNGYSKEISEKMYEDIEKFASYGFNKSHAVVYAMTACRMAYLKYYYPKEFYSAIFMTASGAGDDKLIEYVKEMRARGLNLKTPNINKSDLTFKIDGDDILFPLDGISNVSSQLSRFIISERMENGEFKSFFNFVNRLYPYKITKTNIESLIHAGAFDDFNISRQSLLDSTLIALQYAELNFNDGQPTLDSSFLEEPMLIEANDDIKTKLENEKAVLKIMLSGNLMETYKNKLSAYKVTPLSEAIYKEQIVNIAGVINKRKVITIRKNNAKMAFINIEDATGDIEVTIFPELYDKSFAILESGNIVLIQGRMQTKDEKTSFIANKIRLLEE